MTSERITKNSVQLQLRYIEQNYNLPTEFEKVADGKYSVLVSTNRLERVTGSLKELSMYLLGCSYGLSFIK